MWKNETAPMTYATLQKLTQTGLRLETMKLLEINIGINSLT